MVGGGWWVDGFRERGLAPLARLKPQTFVLALLLLGCKVAPFPDPNDPRGAGRQQPEVLRRQVKGASDALYARMLGAEITDAQYKDLLAKYTDELLKGVKIESLDPARAWEYGDVFRTGRIWDKAEAAFRIAVRVAKDDDRRVNDLLSLAECEAAQGRVAEAIADARKTFDAPPGFKAPILYGVLYRIAPLGAGQGKDAELARLVEDSIRQSDLVRVDETTESGKAFVVALPHHQHNARNLAAKLYLAAGRESEAERVLAGKLPTLRI